VLFDNFIAYPIGNSEVEVLHVAPNASGDKMNKNTHSMPEI